MEKLWIPSKSGWTPRLPGEATVHCIKGGVASPECDPPSGFEDPSGPGISSRVSLHRKTAPRQIWWNVHEVRERAARESTTHTNIVADRNQTKDK
jgi:hypothetical protein